MNQKDTITPSENETLEILQGNQEYPGGEEKLAYTEEESKFRAFLISKLIQARDDRESPHPELDGMTYTQYYESNRKKDLSYIPPKKNKRDVRIVTGTTREKDTTLLSSVLALNLEPVITAFDQDNFVVANLGNHTEGLVKKSREIEEYDKKRGLIYREMISQGDVFVEEYFDEGWVPVTEDVTDWSPDKNTISEFKAPEYKLKKEYEGCKVRMIKGTKVYLGDIHIEDIKEQDIVAVLNVYSRQKAEAKYGKWDRFKFVPKGVDQVVVPVDEGALYTDWNITSVPADKCAELRIYLPRMNRFMILLNGVMMLPIEYPMRAVAPSGYTPVSQGKAEPISNFAYSKSTPSKVKVQQEVFDEITRLMVNKFRQSAEPSLGHAGKQIISPAIFDSGKIFSNMRQNQLFPLIPDRQINSSEFSFYNLIKEQIDANTANPTFSGEKTTGQPTLGQLQMESQQQMKKLGLLLDGVINLEKSMIWHRIPNLYYHWTKVQDVGVDQDKKTLKDIYKTIMVEADIEHEEKGYKVYRFDKPENYPDVWDQVEEEEELSDNYGKKTRIIYLNPDELRQLKHMFYISMIPSDSNASELSQIVFSNHVREALELFGPESLEMEYIKQRWAIKIKENPEKWFKPMDVMQMMQNQAVAQSTTGQPSSPQPNGPMMPKMGKSKTQPVI